MYFLHLERQQRVFSLCAYKNLEEDWFTPSLVFLMCGPLLSLNKKTDAPWGTSKANSILCLIGKCALQLLSLLPDRGGCSAARSFASLIPLCAGVCHRWPPEPTQDILACSDSRLPLPPLEHKENKQAVWSWPLQKAVAVSADGTLGSVLHHGERSAQSWPDLIYVGQSQPASVPSMQYSKL